MGTKANEITKPKEMKIDQRNKQIMESLIAKLETTSPRIKYRDDSIGIIKEHVNYAYTVGHDDMKADIINTINTMFVVEQNINYNWLLNILNKL